MKCMMLWHGGSSYAVGGVEDLETFDSFADALAAFRSYGDCDPFRPCVETCEPDEGGASAWVFIGAESDVRASFERGDVYPDRVIAYGPRGGVRWSPA